MNRIAHALGIVRDNRATALTEFAIVIPVVLLMFLMMIQYVIVARAAQLCNYAAYAAARVYVVRAPIDKSTDKKDAKDKALSAASFAMAPVARLVPGEAFGLPVGSLSSLLPSGLPGAHLAALGEGWFVAKNIRLNSKIGGGDVTIKQVGQQVDVEVIYPQPIFVPGMAELWTLVAGKKGIHHDLKKMREGLKGIPKATLTGIEAFEQGMETFGQTFDPITFFYPYVALRGKCTMGLEEWGSKTEYRPRKPKTVKDAETDPADKAKGAEADKAADAAEAYQKALDNEVQKCKEWSAAREALKQAQSTRNAVYANPNSTAQEKAKADSDLAKAQAAESSAHSAYTAARSVRRQKQATLESITGTKYDDFDCQE